MTLAEERYKYELGCRAHGASQWIGAMAVATALAAVFVVPNNFGGLLLIPVVFFAVVACALLAVQLCSPTFFKAMMENSGGRPTRWALDQAEAEAESEHYRLEAERRRDERYGARHQELRAHWAAIIRDGGGTCSERICVMPTRSIAPHSHFHLAHDHQAGGPSDYLGPAHPECNEHEARLRGVTWGQPEEIRGAAPESDDSADSF